MNKDVLDFIQGLPKYSSFRSFELMVNSSSIMIRYLEVISVHVKLLAMYGILFPTKTFCLRSVQALNLTSSQKQSLS